MASTEFQIMVDKVLTLPREKIGKRVGHLGNTLMTQSDAPCPFGGHVIGTRHACGLPAG